MPRIGQIVNYTLTANDAVAASTSSSGRSSNSAKAGEVFPAMVVKKWTESETSAVQLQVFIDGNFTVWATSVEPGEGEGKFTLQEG